MDNRDVDVKILLIHVVAGWLITSQMTLAHIQLSNLPPDLTFSLGMLGGIGGCVIGMIAYNKRWFLKKD